MNKEYGNRKYQIVNYDSKWKDIFREEARVLSFIFGEIAIAIEHIGSTAVPGMAGKPIIDALVLVDGFAIADTLNRKMASIGYQSLGEYVKPDARLYVKEIDGVRLFNVHVFQKDHPHVREMLFLREYFRGHPEVVNEYSQLKLDLLRRYPNDYSEYRRQKDAWMEKLKARIFRLEE